MNGTSPLAGIDPELREAVVAFLRDWLPPSARSTYKTMMEEDPENWPSHPHFADGVIVRHALRGNGITEEVLGVTDLEHVWAAFLELAVLPKEPPDTSV